MIYIQIDIKLITFFQYTTTLSSFTDGLIPSVIAMNSVGENNTDGFTDGSRPSVKQSSVNPISVANSVANKKNHSPTDTPTVIQTDTRAKKKFLAGTLPTANPSVLLRVITDGITDGVSVGIYGMACNFVATLCLIPTDISRRYGRR
jgi:hypothetical protein